MNEKPARPTSRDSKTRAAEFPHPPHVVLADGLVVDERVLNAVQVVKIAKILSPAMLHLRGLDGLRTAMFEHLDLFATAAAIAIDWPEDDILSLPPDMFVTVVDAVIEVNAEHFATRIAPALERLFTEAAKAAPAESEAEA
jgi:hypothetical protein